MRERITTRSLRVLGSGAALPGKPISTSDLLAKISERFGIHYPRFVNKIVKQLGIETRHICRNFELPLESPRTGDTNPDLAARALQEALAESELTPSEIGYLFGHTTSPHTLLPPNISWVADKIGYDGPYAELRQACTGFANCLQLAVGLFADGNCPAVAIVGSETGSVFFDPRTIEEDREQLVNMLQMGDGAGSIVLAPAGDNRPPRLEKIFFGTLGTEWKPGLSLEKGGSSQPFGTSGVATFKHDFQDIRKNGMLLFDAGAKAAQKAGIKLGDVDRILVHQANGRMGDLMGPHFGIPESKFVVDGDKVGNLGSASIWVALHRLRASAGLKENETVLVLGAESTKYLFGGFLYIHGTHVKKV